MPKSRQPILLQKMAMSILLEQSFRYFDTLGAAGCAVKLREGIFVLKEKICTRLPWFLLSDFCSELLDKFLSKNRSHSLCCASLELIMDMEIIGLKFNPRMMEYVNFEKDGQRFRRLEKLELSSSFACMDKLLLGDLTTFIFERWCTDLDLEIIGRYCSKLQVLKIRGSREITDKSIRALNNCSELRVVDLIECGMSFSGQKLFLSTHKKIEEFFCNDELISHLDFSVHPALNRLVLESYETCTSKEICKITTKFPNLMHFGIIDFVQCDLTPLKSLEKLTSLCFHYDRCADSELVEDSWNNIKKLLGFIGANITSLELFSENLGFYWGQDEINSIFNHCPNIEHLRYSHDWSLTVIPPFPKLKTLLPTLDIIYESIDNDAIPRIEFQTLPELETLSLENFDVSFPVIESIMLDHVKFPKLSVIKTICMVPEDIAAIERIARINNLDFRIDNSKESNWWVEYRYGAPAE